MTTFTADDEDLKHLEREILFTLNWVWKDDEYGSYSGEPYSTWVSEVVVLEEDLENNRVFGFYNIQGHDGGTGFAWLYRDGDIPDAASTHAVAKGTKLKDYPLVEVTGYFGFQ